MKENNDHYYSEFPDIKLKIYSISESLRRHLYTFKTTSGVFSSEKIDLGTKTFIENMLIPETESLLLDLGCGYGPIGIVLARESPKSTVYLVDINKLAIWAAKENIKVNIVDYKKRVFAEAGDYFEPFKKKNLKFDGIYTNPPVRLGRKEFLDLCVKVRSHLKPNRYFQFVIRKKMGAEVVLEHLKTIFLEKNVTVICKKSGYWVIGCLME